MDQIPVAPLLVTFAVTVGFVFVLPVDVGPFAPQDPELVAYESGSGENLMVTPQNRWRNGLGLSRNQRAQGPELANIANQLPAAAWTGCDEEEIRAAFDPPYPTKEERKTIAEEPVNPGCITGAKSVARVNNSSQRPTVCGDVTLALTTPVPFEFQQFTDRYPQISKVARVTVDCEVQR